MLKSLFTENLGTKAAAIFLALVIWFYTNERLSHEIAITLPLRCTPPPGFEIVSMEKDGSSISQVGIRLEGPRAVVMDIVDELSEYTIRNVATPEELREKSVWEIPLSGKHLNLPPEVVLKEITPSSVRLVFEELMTRMLKIDVEGSIVGQLPSGYVHKIRAVRPSEIEIRGPQSVIRNRASIPLADIDLSGRTQTFSQNVSVVPTLEGKPIYAAGAVYVEIEILPEPQQKILEKVKIKIIVPQNFPLPVAIRDDPEIQITLEGPQELLSKAGIENMVIPFVNLTEVYGDDPSKYEAETPYGLTVRYILSPELQGKVLVFPQDKSVSVFLEKPE